MRLVHSEEGAEAAELALVLPALTVLLLASIQLALVGLVRYEVDFMARETTRWLAVNPDTTDSALLTRVDGELVPGMSTAGIQSLTTSPACASLSGGHCSGRTVGNPVQVTFVYNFSSVVFIPTSLFGFALPSTSVTVQVTLPVE